MHLASAGDKNTSFLLTNGPESPHHSQKQRTVLPHTHNILLRLCQIRQLGSYILAKRWCSHNLLSSTMWVMSPEGGARDRLPGTRIAVCTGCFVFRKAFFLKWKSGGDLSHSSTSQHPQHHSSFALMPSTFGISCEFRHGRHILLIVMPNVHFCPGALLRSAIIGLISNGLNLI